MTRGIWWKRGSCQWASPCQVWSTWTPSPTMSPGCLPWMRSDTFRTCSERPRLTETSRWVSNVMYAFKCVKNKMHSRTWLKRSAMDKFIWFFIKVIHYIWWIYGYTVKLIKEWIRLCCFCIFYCGYFKKEN